MFRATEQNNPCLSSQLLGERKTWQECIELCNAKAAQYGVTLDWSGSGGTTSDGRRFWLRPLTLVQHFLVEEIE